MNTKADFNRVISKYIGQEKDYIREHEEVLEILKPLEGKPINGQTLNKTRLGDKFKLVSKYGHFNIEGDYSHLIGYAGGDESTIQIEEGDGHRGFLYLDCANGSAAAERVQKVEAKKHEAVKKFKELEKAYNKFIEVLGEVQQSYDSFDFPAYYDMIRAIEPNERANRAFSDLALAKKFPH